MNEYQSLLWLIGDLLILANATYYYNSMYMALPTNNIFRFAPAWITIGVFYYFSFNLFLFASANFVFKDETSEVGLVFWGFHNLNNIVKNCFFAIGIYFGGNEE